MSDNYIQAAFNQVCAEAVVAEANYVSLYIDLPFYGGPEEGGWWSSDTELVASQEVSSEDEAKTKMDAVKKLSEKMNHDAQQRFNAHCARETEWLEERGLEDDFLPEPDGDERYWVAIESTPGSHRSKGSRRYE